MRPPALTAESAHTQELVDLCLALAEQPDLMEDLQEKARVRLEVMHRAEDGFFAAIDAQGMEYYQRLRTHIDKVEDQFRAYGDALELILDDGFDPIEVAHALVSASRGLRISTASYEEAYLSEGPSGYPVVNLFQNVVQAVSEGRMGRSLLDATCDRYHGFYSGAIEEIEQSQARQKPGVAERKQALQAIVTSIAELRELKNSDGLDSILGRMTAAHAELDAAFDTYHHHEFSEGPAQGPKINWLVHTAEGVLEGTYGPEALERMAQSLLDLTQHNLTEMKNLGRNKLDSELLSEELERMVEAVEEIEDALMLLLDYAQGTEKNVEDVREAIEDLIDSGDALVECAQIVNEAHERAGQVTCVQCQTVQEKGARSCVRCGALLPQQPGEGVYGHSSSSFQLLEGDPTDVNRDEVMTDVMHALFEACEAFMAGKLSREDLSTKVQENTRSVEQALAKLEHLDTPALPSDASAGEQDTAQNFIALAEDALILLSQGAAECHKGLFIIARAAEADDLESLRSGMRTYYDGTQKMWQVRRLDRQFDDYLTPIPPE